VSRLSRYVAAPVCTLLLLLLTACPGSVIEPLPAGAGPGSYSGTFTDEDSGALLGSFGLVISPVGAVDGEGQLNDRSVEITGTFAAGVMDALITDTLAQTSGDFAGQLVGSTLTGDFRMEDPEGGDDIVGLWDGALSP
jgi:hypothetical protein